jgi:serine/threonine protein kinase
MKSLGEESVNGVLHRAAAETLASQLVGEMIQRWRQGERPLAEDFLTQHPALWNHPTAAADLIYEELCLRQEFGPEVPVEQMLDRFPQWRPQLEVLFDCQRVLSPRRALPQFPAAGELLGDFLLLAELGRGAQSRVFLANQLSLADRPVVLKVTPSEALAAWGAHEHLSLARLQHTHIVPLYSVQDDPVRGLRALCMPYFGGATLAQLLDALASQAPARRTGQSLLAALDQVQANSVTPLPFSLHAARGNRPVRPALAEASYVQAVCWIGACLADALHYAHERGLVHLDLKPSNVLLAADGQPMLLDFHLAREPIYPEQKELPWLGGTAGYMSPEQQAALLAIQQGRKVTMPVDGRSDIFSLGVVLYEALGGSLPVAAGKVLPLHRCNAQVSLGLADVVGKCLASDPNERYRDMTALATDLRRYLAHLPLSGVRNRSLVERWRNWRRRRPNGMALAGMMLAVLTAAGAVALGAASHFGQLLDQARAALIAGQRQIERHEWQEAITTLQGGLAVARSLPFARHLVEDLDRQLHRASREDAVLALHRVTDRVRFFYGADHFPPGVLRGLEAACRGLWEQRDRIVKRLLPPSLPDTRAAVEDSVHDDVLDLAILWADLQVRLAGPQEKEEARRKARAVLAEAEALFGPSPVLDAERKIHGGLDASRLRSVSGREQKTGGDAVTVAGSSWEHYALGRSFLRSGQLDRAAEELEGAVRSQPQALWPNFYRGLCAYRRGRYADAVAAFSICIGAAPEPAGCFYNRALAYEGLGSTEQALHDYDQALRLDPTLAVAAQNRGMLHYRAKHYADAIRDLHRAGELGADPAVIAFDRALVNLARGEYGLARRDLSRALSHDLQHAEARKLQDRPLDR